MTYATPWMKVEETMLNIISQSQRQIFYDFTYVSYLEQVNSQRQKNRIEVIRGWGKGNGELFNGYRVSIWDDEKVLEVESGDGCIIL